jgi:hypothetical protein
MTHKHPSAAFWATVVVVAVLVGYPLSFGPACWWFSRKQTYLWPMVGLREIPTAPPFCWPIVRAVNNGPQFVISMIRWYATIGSDEVAVRDAGETIVFHRDNAVPEHSYWTSGE